MKNIPLVIELTSIKWSNERFVIGTALVHGGPSSIQGRRITIRGNLPVATHGDNIGNCYECVGTMTTHPRWGEQWKIVNAIETVPRDRLGIIRYLAKAGLDPAIANSFVTEHGEHAVRLLAEGSPMELASIPQEFVDRWRNREDITHDLLRTPGLGEKTLQGIINYFASVELLQAAVDDDPYTIMQAPRVSFAMADEFASQLGIGKDDPRRMRAATVHVLKHGCRKGRIVSGENDGHTWMPRHDLLDATGRMLGFSPLKVQDALLQPSDNAPAVFDGDDRVYRAEMLRAEQLLADAIQRLRQGRSYLPLGGIDYDAIFEQAPFIPSEEQREAVRHIFANKVSILTGGPGTGKSSIIRIVLDALESVRVRSVYLCAPTGKAAKRLSAVTGHDATTIHRLAVALEKHDEDTPIPDKGTPIPSVVIIDECSMADTFTAEWLIGPLPDDCHLILVGDVNQLPSIGPGRVLHDLITAGVPTATLTKVMRNTGGILDAVYAMNRGHVLPAGTHPDYHHFETASPDQVVERVLWLVTEGIPQMYGISSSEVRVIAPQRGNDITKGCGVNRLNAVLQQVLNPPDFNKNEARWYDATLREGDLLLWTENNYGLGLVNGDEVTVNAVYEDYDNDLRYNTTFVELNNGITMRLSDLTATHGWASTVHKAQGSEYRAVVFVAHTSFSDFLMTRRLVFTAMSRAQELLVIVGERRALERAAGNTREDGRRTGLSERLAAKELPMLDEA